MNEYLIYTYIQNHFERRREKAEVYISPRLCPPMSLGLLHPNKSGQKQVQHIYLAETFGAQPELNDSSFVEDGLELSDLQAACHLSKRWMEHQCQVEGSGDCCKRKRCLFSFQLFLPNCLPPTYLPYTLTPCTYSYRIFHMFHT